MKNKHVKYSKKLVFLVKNDKNFAIEIGHELLKRIIFLALAFVLTDLQSLLRLDSTIFLTNVKHLEVVEYYMPSILLIRALDYIFKITK